MWQFVGLNFARQTLHFLGINLPLLCLRNEGDSLWIFRATTHKLLANLDNIFDIYIVTIQNITRTAMNYSLQVNSKCFQMNAIYSPSQIALFLYLGNVDNNKLTSALCNATRSHFYFYSRGRSSRLFWCCGFVSPQGPGQAAMLCLPQLDTLAMTTPSQAVRPTRSTTVWAAIVSDFTSSDITGAGARPYWLESYLYKGTFPDNSNRTGFS